MNEPMVWSDDDRLRSPDGTYVSPELALVDPELAAWARDQLPNPLEQAALARISSRLETESPAGETARLPVPLPLPPGRSRRVAGVAVATVVLAAALLAADVRIEFGKTPASAETAGASETPEPSVPIPSVELETTPARPTVPVPHPPRPATPKPKPAKPDTRRSQTPQTPAQIEPQRFAWAPAPGATGYHVELFRGTQVVYAVDTTEPAVMIPSSWSFRGRKRTLQAGSYRWYVWPVTDGRRAVRAIVQATVTVPAR